MSGKRPLSLRFKGAWVHVPIASLQTKALMVPSVEGNHFGIEWNTGVAELPIRCLQSVTGIRKGMLVCQCQSFLYWKNLQLQKKSHKNINLITVQLLFYRMFKILNYWSAIRKALKLGQTSVL